MTDEELIARLRDAPADNRGNKNCCLDAADRIEALVKAQGALIEARDIMELCWKEQKARADATEARLAKAVETARAYRIATKHLGPCPETSAGLDATLAEIGGGA